MGHAILLISCPDKIGITASITNFVYANHGNIIDADQHIDEQTNTFFMRIEWSLERFAVGSKDIGRAFAKIADKFQMTWDLFFTDNIPKVAIFASSYLHCLYDLLLKHDEGQLPCEIALIVSNHPQARKVAAVFGIKFYEFPMSAKNKISQEKKQLNLLAREKIDTVVLARYMQILPPKFVKQFKNNIINIHHSFLPAFAGKGPYRQAYRKGVKIIGATSHYVTEKLDDGPIIEQDTVRISHRDSLKELILKGEDLERMVLSRAVRWHLERKILCYDNKTVVFA